MGLTSVRKNLPLLRAIAHAKPSTRKAILSQADKGLVCSVCEIIQNIMNGNVQLPPHVLKLLAKHKHVLRRIVDKRTKLREKRALLVQKGGFLGAILPALASVLVGLIAR